MGDAPDLRTAAQALLDRLAPNLNDGHQPTNSPQRRRFKAMYIVAPYIREQAGALRAVLAAEATEPPPDEWVTRYLVLAGGDTHQLWAVVPEAEGPPAVPIRVRVSDLSEVDDAY
jgi:hypothetical protein